MGVRRKCFQSCMSLLLIWDILGLIIITIVITSSQSNQQRPPPELARNWGWNRSEISREKISGEYLIGLAKIETRSTYFNNRRKKKKTSGRNVNSLSTSSSSSWGNKSKTNILIWIQYPLPFHHLTARFDNLVTSMKADLCFEECQLILGRNKYLAKEADAIVVFMFSGKLKRRDLPLRTNWDQIWVYHQDEPPTHHRPGADLNGVFNWTMTYRRDSDIYQPYYRMIPLTNPLSPTEPLHFENGKYNSSEWINMKSKLAIAVISNCKAPSKRLPILRKLQSSGIPIDIFGKCGNKSIEPRELRVKDEFSNWVKISRNYRFYFAIENSICSEYVTEKLWRSLELGIVPIVMGRANYSEIAPPNSFIDLRDFPNPKDLKKYLESLVGDTEAYMKFFEWRRQYRVVLNGHLMDNFCELCSKLRQHKKRLHQDPAIYGGYPIQYKAHEDLKEWWNSVPGRPGQPVCISPEQFGFKNYFKRKVRRRGMARDRYSRRRTTIL